MPSKQKLQKKFINPLNPAIRPPSPNHQKQPPEVLYEKKVSYKFRKIHRKTPVSDIFFTSNFIKKETVAQVFSREFYKKHLLWLLLEMLIVFN